MIQKEKKTGEQKRRNEREWRTIGYKEDMREETKKKEEVTKIVEE
jgi:hypothetical protein